MGVLIDSKKLPEQISQKPFLPAGIKPYYADERAGIYIIHGDCRDILPHIDPVDLVLTDPPYGLGDKWKSTWDAKQGRGRLWNGDVPGWDKSTVNEALVADILKAGALKIIWGGNYYLLPPMRGWLIWDKIQVCDGAECEMAWTNLGIPTRVFRMSRTDAYINRTETKKSHPTEKPIQLMRWCLDFVSEAKTVIDPFMGSGTTLRAAKDLGRKAIGIEIEEKYCEIAVRRLAQEVLL